MRHRGGQETVNLGMGQVSLFGEGLAGRSTLGA
jgi:hypothetical protein